MLCLGVGFCVWIEIRVGIGVKGCVCDLGLVLGL